MNSALERPVAIDGRLKRAFDASLLARRLRAACRGDVLFDPFTRGRYSTDASIYQIEPLGVVIPKRASDIEAAMAIAREHRAPVVDCSKYLRSIVSLDVDTSSCLVEPGITLDTLNKTLKAHNLAFPVDI